MAEVRWIGGTDRDRPEDALGWLREQLDAGEANQVVVLAVSEDGSYHGNAFGEVTAERLIALATWAQHRGMAMLMDGEDGE